MDAEKRVRTVDHHEWTLKAPAHHTEVDKAVAVAEHERATLAAKGIRTGDVHVSGDGEQLLISFEAEQPKSPKRAVRGGSAEDLEAAGV